MKPQIERIGNKIYYSIPELEIEIEFTETREGLNPGYFTDEESEEYWDENLEEVRQEVLDWIVEEKSPNDSEQQLKDFLYLKKLGGFKLTLELRAQGDQRIIADKAVNLCGVHIDGNKYLFGGISLKFYDKMVKEYHQKPLK